MALLLSLLILFQLQAGHAFQPVSQLQNTENYVARNWMVEDGLPVNAVNNIIQDEKGYIWFTTYDGIVKFDGINFEVFNHSNTPQMPQNRAVQLYQQQGEGIWAGLENGGIVLIKEGKFTYFGPNQGFTNADLTTTFEDSKGRMWFGTYQGLYKYEKGRFERAFIRETPIQNRISNIYETGDGSILAATFDGLVKLKDDDIEVYNYKAGTVHNEFSLLHKSRDGSLWVGARTGLLIFENEELKRVDLFKPLEGEYITAVYEYNGITFISTDRGLYLYDDTDDTLKKLEVYATQYNSYQHFHLDAQGTLWMLKNNGKLAWYIDGKVVPARRLGAFYGYHYNRIAEDREGNIWLTTARNGIVRIKRSRTTNIGIPEGLSGGNILGIFEDSLGRFWVGTRDKGLNIIDGNKITQLSENQQLASDIVHTIAEDKEGNIWVGYYQQGLQKITDTKITSYELGFDAGINDIRAIFVGSDSTIWLGTYGGLVKFDPTRKNHVVYTKENGLAGNLVRYIDEDQNGGLWIGTADGGVSYFKEGAFTNYTEQQGLSSNNIRSVYVDEEEPKTVWVGTEDKGLNRIRGDSITSLGVKEGLPDHIIHYISQDSQGWLWMSSNKGIIKIKKKELNAYLDGKAPYFAMVNLGREEGMRNPECNGSFQQGGLRTTGQTFWFSTQEGVAIFEINPSFQNKVAPIIDITELSANGEQYSGSVIDLEPGVTNFEVGFHALTFVTPEKTHFRYKLEGYNKDWTEITNQRSVSFIDIPPGNYTFKVLAANNDGVWSSRAAMAAISITPEFYQRTWFYVLVFVFFGIAYYSISRIRFLYLVKKQQRLRLVINEQTKKLRSERDAIQKQNKLIEKQAISLEQSNKAKDKFFSIIGHDLRNPFQALVGFSGMILSDYENTNRDDIQDSLQEIEKASKRLLSLVENLLSWASLQTEKVKPEPEWFLLDEIIEKNRNLFSQTCQQKEIDITVEINAENEIYADRNMIDTLVRNLVSNAIKFTERGGKIVVKTRFKADIFYIEVCDTGIGMSDKMVQKLMQLDESTSRSGTENEAGTGLGLIICKDMVSLHGGKITLESEQDGGTIFTVALPRKHIFNEN